MAAYYVNKNAQSNGDHEVHTTGCAHMPELANQVYVGDFPSCVPAVAKAKQQYSKANGCYYCCNECHTQ